MSTAAPSGFTRRALLSLLGSGVVVASAALLLRRRSPDAETAHPGSQGVVPYADHDGWMVTPAEKQRLAEAGAATPAAR
jgi:hypothetical protein